MLNEIQRRLAEANHNLVYEFLERNGLTADEGIVDWYGVAAEGLCVAALTFGDAETDAFKDYAWKCMKDAYAIEISKITKQGEFAAPQYIEDIRGAQKSRDIEDEYRFEDDECDGECWREHIGKLNYSVGGY